MKQQLSKPVISASEIGEYAYCSRAWWYKHVVKLAPPAGESEGRFVRGRLAHAMHGGRVRRATRLRALGLGLALCGLLIVAVSFIVAAITP